MNPGSDRQRANAVRRGQPNIRVSVDLLAALLIFAPRDVLDVAEDELGARTFAAMQDRATRKGRS